MCILKFSVSRETSIVFHSGSNYDYHFIITELAEDFKGQFTCLGDINGNQITFSVPIEEEVTKKDKNGKKSHKLYPTYYNLLIAQDLWQPHYKSC